MTDRQIVVTGLGATTPLGGDVPTTWDAVLAGKSGAAPLPPEWLERYDLPVTFAARLAEPPEAKLSRPETKRLDPSGQYALVAAREAWADAGLATPARRPGEQPGDGVPVVPERLAVCVASGIGGVWTLLDSYDTLKEKGPKRILPLTVPMLMPNGPAAAISLEFGARAGVHTAVSACASGAESIAQAVDLIRSGRADVVIAGGTEAAIHPLPIAGFASMHALSTRNDDPAAASRPYDVDRDGFVIGEGAAVMVLESAEHAAARGARVHAVLAGAGITSDAHHIAAPEPQGAGASRAIRAALEDAHLSPADVVHVNAHATSTPVGDVAEVAALRAGLGPALDGVAVSATKSMTGHLLGAAGALEAVFTVLAVRDRVAPPTINLLKLDPRVKIDVVGDQPRELRPGAAVNNAFGFGGHNVALAFVAAS
ncbi:beta-ketoacyl-[acyl-carrier-protein] synthase family protein [Spongisporangium articulatum]|uniref:3-oxoacyl-[acyl-carrier-protein] synthase 2 n=1 Tax=Spongisporangium articulatum TaxID=3362603 RepID=A0ABW8ANU6_9ACTN